MELAVLALSCGSTKVPSPMWPHPVSSARLAQLVYLVQQMKAMPDGEGNLLAKSVVMMGTEINDGSLHDHRDMPLALSGQAGGALETGPSLDLRGGFGARNVAHTKLWVSIAGLTGWRSRRSGTRSRAPGGW